MRKLFSLSTLLLLLLFPALLQAQTSYQNGGNITSSGSSCGVTNCVSLAMPANSATLTVGVTGTFSATLAVEESQDGGRTWTSAGTALTATGTTVYGVSAFTNFRVRASSFVSGNAGVNLQASIASSGNGGGTLFGSGPPSGPCSPNQQYVDTVGATLYICPAGTWVAVGSGGGGSTPRLDQVLNQNQNKLFDQGGATLGFTDGPGLNISGETSAMTVPGISNCAPTGVGQLCYDSVANNYVVYNGASEIVGSFPNSVASGDVAGFLNNAGKLSLQDLGPLNGSSGQTILQVNLTNVQEGDSICWDSGTSQFVNCTEGVPVTVVAGTTYTVNCSTDRGAYLLFTSSSAIAVTLPQATSTPPCDANFFTYVRTLNATLTVTPTTSTINDGGGAGSTLVISPGYGSNIFSDNTNYFAKDGPFRKNPFALMMVEGFDVNTTGAYQWQSPNNGSTGTTANKMACDDGTGKEIICSHTTSTTDVPDGVAVSGIGVAPGTTGNVGICIIGFCSVVFDNSATANHFAQVSTSVDGDLADVGATAPTNGQPYYKVFTGNAGAGTQAVIRDLTPSEQSAAQVGGGGKSTVQINAANTKPVANFANGGGVTWSKVDSGNTSTITATVSGGISQAYQTIDSNGTAQTQRSTVNFISNGGSSVSCVDNSGSTRTDCTVTSGSGGTSPVVNNLGSVNYTIQNGDNGARLLFTGTDSITLPQANQITSSPFVANRTNGRTTCTTCTTASFTPTAGNTLYLMATEDSDTTSTATVTSPDSNGNIWTQVGTCPTPTSSRPQCMFRSTNVNAGATTVSFTWSSSSLDAFWNVVEYNGITPDSSAIGSSNSGNSPAQATVNARFPTEAVIYMSTNLNGCNTGYTSRDTGQLSSPSKICDAIFNGVTSITAITAGSGGNSGIIAQSAGTGATVTFPAGWYTTVENTGIGVLTITPTTSTINGRSTLIVYPNQSYTIMSDGVNYNAELKFLSNFGNNGTADSIYATPQTAGTSSIGATTIIGVPSAPVSTFKMSGYAEVTVVGSSCAGNTTVALNAIYTSPASAGGTTTVTLGTFTVTTNGVIGTSNASYPDITFRAKGSTNIQFSTTYTAGGSCSPAPTVQVTPVLQVM